MFKVGCNSLINRASATFLLSCTDKYLGKSARRISERIIDHGSRDKKSHLLQHAVVNEHRDASYDDFKIIGSGFRNNTLKERFLKPY